MADNLAQRDALLSKILSQMSMETADLVSDTLQVKGHGEVNGQGKVKGHGGVKGQGEVKEDEKYKSSRKKQKDEDGESLHTFVCFVFLPPPPPPLLFI